MLKKLCLAIALLLVSVAGLSFNVLAHELGHYAVAESFHLNPKIGFQGGANFIWNGEMIAYTSYVGGDELQDVLISAAGPLANLFVGLFSVAMGRKSRNLYSQLFFLAFAITAFLSFISNIMPSNGSDGEIILSFL